MVILEADGIAMEPHGVMNSARVMRCFTSPMFRFLIFPEIDGITENSEETIQISLHAVKQRNSEGPLREEENRRLKM